MSAAPNGSYPEIDTAALQAAHEIVALPEGWPYTRKKAAIQVIVAREMMRARSGDLAQTVLAPDHVAVPKAALDWLFGQGPDDKGWLFGECSEAQKAMNTKNPRRYWWRAKFRTMLSAVPSTDREGGK